MFLRVQRSTWCQIWGEMLILHSLLIFFLNTIFHTSRIDLQAMAKGQQNFLGSIPISFVELSRTSICSVDGTVYLPETLDLSITGLQPKRNRKSVNILNLISRVPWIGQSSEKMCIVEFVALTVCTPLAML